MYGSSSFLSVTASGHAGSSCVLFTQHHTFAPHCLILGRTRKLAPPSALLLTEHTSAPPATKVALRVVKGGGRDSREEDALVLCRAPCW